MSRSQSTRTRESAPTTTTPEERAPEVAPSPESLIGNAAVVDAVGEVSEEQEDPTWFTTLVDAPGVDEEEVAQEVEEAPSEDNAAKIAAAAVEGANDYPEDDGPLDLASRPDKVKRGMRGALIGSTPTLEVHSDPETEAAVAHTINNGTPCKVLRTKQGWAEVSFRVGKNNETGWVPQGLISDQPSLAPDEDNKALQDDYTYTLVEGSQDTEELEGTDVEQGALGDCFFIAGMNAVGNANADFLEESVEYDASTGMYRVRFFEENGYDTDTWEPKYDEVWIEVDGYLPTKGTSTSGAYASAASGKLQWGAIIEKAYAKWKGGYDVIGEGGYESQAMEELAGVSYSSLNPQTMAEEDVLPFFRKAEEDGLAVAAGSYNARHIEVQTPLTGTESGPYKGTIKQIHSWNEVEPGTLRITDTGGQVGSARDSGSDGDKSASIEGSDVDSGEITYGTSAVEVAYTEGKGPEKATDLEVQGEFHGMLYPAKQVIGNHAYSFDKVVGETIQLYNPWGSYQPKPLTASEFLEYYQTLSTVQVPQAKGMS